jgi:hypothetical protein
MLTYPSIIAANHVPLPPPVKLGKTLLRDGPLAFDLCGQDSY